MCREGAWVELAVQVAHVGLVRRGPHGFFIAMLGILFLIISIITGRQLLDRVYPDYRLLSKKSYSGKELDLPAVFVLLPFWFFSGTLLTGWLTYIAACIVSAVDPGVRHPLTAANIISLTICVIIDVILEYTKAGAKPHSPSPRHEADAVKEVSESAEDQIPVSGHRGEPARVLAPAGTHDAGTGSEKYPLSRSVLIAAFFIILTVFVTYMMYRSFYINRGTVRVGLSVFSDFAVHLGMIRSFSFGNNFPTQYSHFAGEDIRYHFMFQFLAGNLEYLGLPIDHALNFPSILSFMGMSMLLFVFGAKLCGSRLAGVISVLMMVFRSSPSLFRFLGSLPKNSISRSEIFNRNYFFSYTPKEDWGLWNFKVYLNQRHLAFGMGVAFMALIIFAPLFYEGIKKLRDLFKKDDKAALISDHVLAASAARPILCGLLLGACAFWNGAMVIGCLCVLFVMALISSHRLEYLLTAIIAVTLSSVQSFVFIRGSAVKPAFQYGFISAVPTFWGSISYLLALSGALLILAAVYFVTAKGTLKYMLLAFAAPLVFAFTMSLTPDVTVNHKYVMLAFILIGIPVAALVAALLKSSRITRFIAGLVLLVLLTATGIYECRIVRNIDLDHLDFKEDDKLTCWIRENSDSKDIWLTDMISIHEAVMGGAMLYYGWPYYAWSAGYDTVSREEKVAEMFSTPDEERLKELVSAEGISFIMVDAGLREMEHYNFREDVIAAAYPLVFQNGDISIYKAE